MRNSHESRIISFEDAVLRIEKKREIQRLGEILEGSASSEPSGESIEREIRMPNVFNIFVPPGAR